MQPKIVQVSEARLFRIQNNSITFLEMNDLTIQKAENGTAILRIGTVSHTLTPETVIWFDSPFDDEQQCLTYYFRNTQTDDYMIKINRNTLEVHEAVKSTGCELRERKVYFKHPNYNATNSNKFYQLVGSLGSIVNYGASTLGVGIAKGAEYFAGGIEKFGGILANNINPGQPVNMPVARNISGQAQNMSGGAINMARQLIGKFFTATNVGNYIAPSEQDHPVVRAGKNALGGAFNFYSGALDGINHLQQGVANGAGRVAERRYGNDANQIIQNTMGTMNNLEGVIREPIRQVGHHLSPQAPNNV